MTRTVNYAARHTHTKQATGMETAGAGGREREIDMQMKGQTKAKVAPHRQSQ